VKQAKVFVNGTYAGDLKEIVKNREYQFIYRLGYEGGPVSLTMPVHQQVYTFDKFPPFFEGLLPEGAMLAALLKKRKLDADDYFEQLLWVGQEMVGNVTVERVL
jgi:serine/threonine-protein kinase HipA